MMDCLHPPNKRFTYRDRFAPLGREGQEWCDACGRRVPPNFDEMLEAHAAAIEARDDSAEIIDIRPAMRERDRDRLFAELIASLDREA